jgi:hypothetical protein
VQVTTLQQFELQADSDIWLKEYNEQQPYSGKYCFLTQTGALGGFLGKRIDSTRAKWLDYNELELKRP